jgi:hypothetical protein
MDFFDPNLFHTCYNTVGTDMVRAFLANPAMAKRQEVTLKAKVKR